MATKLSGGECDRRTSSSRPTEARSATMSSTRRRPRRPPAPRRRRPPRASRRRPPAPPRPDCARRCGAKATSRVVRSGSNANAYRDCFCGPAPSCGLRATTRPAEAPAPRGRSASRSSSTAASTSRRVRACHRLVVRGRRQHVRVRRVSAWPGRRDLRDHRELRRRVRLRVRPHVASVAPRRHRSLRGAGRQSSRSADPCRNARLGDP